MSRLALFRRNHNYLLCIRCYFSESSTRGLRFSHTARYALNTLDEVVEMIATHRNLDMMFGERMWKPVFNTNIMVFDSNNKLVKWSEHAVESKLRAGLRTGETHSH